MQIEITAAYLQSQGLSQTFPDRFWAKVDLNGPIPVHRHELGGCWVWTARKDPKGYGRIGSKGKYGRVILAHRASWVLHFGPIPEGKHILHHCDNPPCVRPSHLWLGTLVENNNDMRVKGRGINPPPNDKWGENHPSAKLTQAQVDEIRQLAPTLRYPCKVLSEQFAVSRAAISLIVHRKNWK